MTRDHPQGQAALPASIPLFRHSPPRRPFDFDAFHPARVTAASDLPPYLVLGSLDESSFRASAIGWSASWRGAEMDTFLQIDYSATEDRYSIRQSWCGVSAGFSQATGRMPLQMVVQQVLYSRFPSAWDLAAKEVLERSFQVRYVEPPQGMPSFCGIPDGAFRTIAFPVAIENLRRVRAWLAKIAASSRLAYPIAAEVKLLFQVINYVEGRAPEWTRCGLVAFQHSMADTGTVPQGLPVRETGADGSSAWTLRRCLYVSFVTVPFAGLKDLLTMMSGASGPVRAVADPALRFEFQPLVVPVGFEMMSRSVAVWDADRTTRSTLQFVDPFGRPSVVPADGKGRCEAGADAQLLEAERISADAIRAMRRIVGEAIEKAGSGSDSRGIQS